MAYVKADNTLYGPPSRFDDRNSQKVKNANVPATNANSFDRVKFLRDGLIYDPSYILKFKGPSLHQMIDRINELAIAISDLQTVVTNIVETEMTEDRKVIDNTWAHVKRCCDRIGISYSPSGKLWDGVGVVEEGIDAYTCHLKIKS